MSLEQQGVSLDELVDLCRSRKQDWQRRKQIGQWCKQVVNNGQDYSQGYNNYSYGY
jgi:hypothetical protein